MLYEVITSQGRYRACAIRNDRLEWVLLVDATPQLPDLEWLDRQFANDTIDHALRRQLLSASADREQPAGAVICSCFQVREPEIRAAIAQGNGSVAELGKRLKCGTNCGRITSYNVCYTKLLRLVSTQPGQQGVVLEHHRPLRTRCIDLFTIQNHTAGGGLVHRITSYNVCYTKLLRNYQRSLFYQFSISS